MVTQHRKLHGVVVSAIAIVVKIQRASGRVIDQIIIGI